MGRRVPFQPSRFIGNKETKENEMRLPLLLCVTTLVATTALSQEEPSSKSSQPGSSSQPGVSSQSSQSSDTTLSPTGRGSGYSGQQQHFRSTKVIGAQVKTSTGEEIGRIEDVVLNPTSGRIDFAVISAENKLCPVPWQLLSVSGQGGQGSSSSSFQGSATSSASTTPGTSPSTTTPSSPTSPQAGAGVYASSSASMGQQPTFTLNIDKSKLQSGPSFDRSRWPEMSASWSQRIYSHFGVQAETGVGGTGSGSIRTKPSSSSTTPDQGGTGSSSDSSSGKSSSEKDSSSKSSPDTKK
jgi:sporulation protein YlmC with PRC-barrel domain